MSVKKGASGRAGMGHGRHGYHLGLCQFWTRERVGRLSSARPPSTAMWVHFVGRDTRRLASAPTDPVASCKETLLHASSRHKPVYNQAVPKALFGYPCAYSIWNPFFMDIDYITCAKQVSKLSYDNNLSYRNNETVEVLRKRQGRKSG
jgi:hypothetical protein